MIRKYSKPILFNENPSSCLYKEEYFFKNKLDDNYKVGNESITFFFAPALNSLNLNQLIKENKAKPFYKIQTNRFSEMHEFNLNENVKCTIDKSILERFDKIQITLYVVASKQFEMNFNNELIEDVCTIPFVFKKGDLLAISNTETVNYSLSGNPFINISLAQQQEGKGILLSCLNKQVIQIKVGPSLNEAYTRIQQKNEIRDVLNPFLAFTAILYSLEKMIKDLEGEYKEKDWFKSLDQAFVSDKYDTIDEFVTSMREEFDVDTIFAVAQQILNNSLENRIVGVSRRF